MIQFSAIALGETLLVAHQQGSSGHFEDLTLSMLKNIPSNANTKVTYQSQNYQFHVIVEDQITYLCVAEESFGKRVPYAFLQEIKSKFSSTTLRSRAFSARNYEFQQDFGNVLSREMERYSSGDTGDQLSKARSEVDQVKVIMTQNIERVLQRGEHLDDLVTKTEELHDTANVFRVSSRRVARKMWWRNVKMWIIIGIIGAIILTFIILLATGTIGS